MLFNSLSFALFFVILTGLNFTLPHRFRWMLMLAASYYFYMCWNVGYILLIAASTLITWYAGLQISKTASPNSSISNTNSSNKAKQNLALQESYKKRKRFFLIISLILNLGALLFFKYFNFFTTSLFEISTKFNLFTGHDAPLLHIMLPVGISFYTFQTVSYTIDIYQGKIEPERHLGIFALYVAFWPRIVAGPIERAGKLIPQFRQVVSFDYTTVTDGLRLVMWGMVKKVVIADQIAVYVNQVFDHCQDYTGIPLIIASVLFTIQIYCDFSGYSDMAIGTAKIMGYELTENFKHPYFAASLREFWQRWHISLSTWFRDYVYIPLGGKRVVKWRFYYNLFITFLVSGLWHGANWTFVIWGGLHGIYLIVENILEEFFSKLKSLKNNNSCLDNNKGSVRDRVPSKLQNYIRVAITLFLVNYAWIFFRANSVADAFSITGRMFMFGGENPAAPVVEPSVFILSMALILLLVIVEFKEQSIRIEHYIATLPTGARWSIYTLGLWAIIISTIFGVKQEFIYFQF
ncbi:MAG: MBOAT family protein [Desulfamplus sp.]|nr:MBOAT family protein [Desulfamplus sp.]